MYYQRSSSVHPLVYNVLILYKRCTFPLQTERTQSMIWPVSSLKALHLFNSWSHSFSAPPSLDLQRAAHTNITIYYRSFSDLSCKFRKQNTLGIDSCKGQATYGRSLPPVTMSPSRNVVYMVNTGPVWALATILTRMCSFHTHTSPLMVPVNVKLFWKENKPALI